MSFNLSQPIGILAFVILPLICHAQEDRQGAPPRAPIRAGWIGAITGPAAKYGVYEAAQLALDDVNRDGGVNGRPLELVAEDGKCSGQSAVTAAMKLIDVDAMRYIIGGHCSPETMAIAPLAERKRVVLLAASTSNPYLTPAGDYIFRITVPNTNGAEKMAKHAYEKRKLRRIGIVFAETDYARPAAEHFKTVFEKLGGKAVLAESFTPSETDFRPMLMRLKTKGAEGIYIGVQMPETADLLMKQTHELNIKLPHYGNEITGWTLATTTVEPSYYDGLIYAEPQFDLESARTKQFVARFKSRYGVQSLPMAETTAEAYDAVMVLAQALRVCGEDPQAVKKWLYSVRDYEGVSGKFSIDQNGDGVRNHVLKKIERGRVIILAE